MLKFVKKMFGLVFMKNVEIYFMSLMTLTDYILSLIHYIFIKEHACEILQRIPNGPNIAMLAEKHMIGCN